MSTSLKHPTPNERFITPTALARRWSFHPESVRRICRMGRLPTLRIGRRIRISLASIEAIETGWGSSYTCNPAADPKVSPVAQADRLASVGNAARPLDIDTKTGGRAA